MQITLNEVFRIRSPAPDTVRVLYLDDERVVVISLFKKDTLPYEIPKMEFGYAIEDQDAETSREYPVAVSTNPTEAQERAMERAWKIIGSFVTDIPDCYDRKIRSRLSLSIIPLCSGGCKPKQPPVRRGKAAFLSRPGRGKKQVVFLHKHAEILPVSFVKKR